MTDSNRVKMSFIEEDEWGVTPAGPLRLLNITGETFATQADTSRSNIIRSDRQVPDIVRLSENASGDLNLELHADESALDVFLRQLLQSEEWSTPLSTTRFATISDRTLDPDPPAHTNDGRFRVHMPRVLGVTGSFLQARGCWVRISGSGLLPQNTGYFQIGFSVDNNEFYVHSDSMTPQDIVPDVTIELASVIRNGTIFASNTIQRENSSLFVPEVFSVPGNPGVPAVPSVPSSPGVEFFTYTGSFSIPELNDETVRISNAAFAPLEAGDNITVSVPGFGVVAGDYTIIDKRFGTSIVLPSRFISEPTIFSGAATFTRAAVAAVPGTPGSPAIPAIPATGDFHIYTGMSPATLSMSVVPEDFITATIGFVGRRESSQSTSAGTGAELPASTNESLTGASDVYGVREGNGLTNLDITNLTLNYDNALANRPAVGSLPPIGIRSGAIVLTGTLEAYFETLALYEKFKEQNESSLSFRVEDDSGRARIFTIPALKYTGGSAPAGGLDTDIIVTMEFTAYMDDALGITFQIDRFGPTA